MATDKSYVETGFNFTLNHSNITFYLLEALSATLLEKKVCRFVLTMLTICPFAMVINLVVISSSFWIRRPLTPHIYLSISLAAADFYSSVIWILYLIVYFLLPLFNFNIQLHCIRTTVEVLRLSSILVIVAHLLSLAVVHYLGTLKPLHYIRILSHRKTTILTCIIWILPHIFLITYFSSVTDQGYQSEYCKNEKFIHQKTFHITYSSIVITPVIIMVFIYMHIFVIVRRHQFRQLEHISARYSDVENLDFKQIQKQMTSNIKAIKTTLIILGSYVIGYLPAIMVFLLLCIDCPINSTNKNVLKHFNLLWVVNVLLLTKTIVNPFIYTTRIKEVKIALYDMYQSVSTKICRSLNTFHNHDTSSQKTQQTTSSSNTSSQNKKKSSVEFGITTHK